MLTILRRRDFALLCSAAVVSQIGDWLLITALPFYVYLTTGSALASGATFAASYLPTILIGSVAGVFVDRWNRKRLLIVGGFLQCAVLLLLLLARSRDDLWLIYAVAVAESTLALFVVPAFNSAIPHVVPEAELVRANALLSMGENVARLLAPPLAGLLLATMLLGGVVLVDAATFAFYGSAMVLLAAPLDVPGRVGAPSAGVWREWIDGLRIVRRTRWVGVLFTVPAISLLGDGMFTALLAAFVTRVLGADALFLGWMLTLRGVGGLLGGLLLGAVEKRLRVVALIGPCSLISALLLLLMVLAASRPLTIAFMGLLGVFIIGVFVTISTLLQNGIPDRFRGRVFAAYGTCSALAALVGNLLGGVLGDRLGIQLMLCVSAALGIVAGCVALALLRGSTARAAGSGIARERMMGIDAAAPLGRARRP